jgi:hypothetical protein
MPKARARAMDTIRGRLLSLAGASGGAFGGPAVRRMVALDLLHLLEDLEAESLAAQLDAIWRTVGCVLLAAGHDRLWDVLYDCTDEGRYNGYGLGDPGRVTPTPPCV